MLVRMKKPLTSFVLLVFLTATVMSVSFRSSIAYAFTVPTLTVSEISVNGKDTASSKQMYEFVEIRNNSNSAVNLSDYRINYNNATCVPRTYDMSTSATLGAGEVKVLWIYNTDAAGKTLADFKSHYNVSISDSSIYIVDVRNVYSGLGLVNTGYSEVILATDSGSEVCIAKYNDATGNDSGTTIDAAADKTVIYEFPQYLVDGNITVRKIANNQTATPGSVYTMSSLPQMWITELMPNPRISTTDGTDAYEYMELYNNTANAINLAGYTVRYYWDYADLSHYTDFNLSAAKNIPAHGYMVVWIKAQAADGKTLADFNTHYRLPVNYLNTENVYEYIHSGPQAFGNAGKKTVELRTDSGTAICSVTYNDGTADDGTSTIDTQYEDRSIIYEYPVDNTKKMRKAANNQFPTPSDKYDMFRGQLHSHTGYSDGAQTPNDAYLWARDQGNADFFAITDHSQMFDNPGDWTLSTEWADMKQKADYYNKDNEFAAIAGFEMTWNNPSGRWGHMNTFNTKWFEQRENLEMDQYSYFDKLSLYPDSISQFNHPMLTEWDNSSKFKNRTAYADDLTPLLEVGYPEWDGYYIRALDWGWHVAPAINDDNHSADWITRDTNRTVVMASRLTRDNILDAIRSRRVYASIGDADLRIKYTINGFDMGSRLTGQNSLNLRVDISNPGDNISKVSVIANGGTVVASQTYTNTCCLTYTATLSPQYKYYFVRVDQEDGDYALTAPIWIEDSVPVELTMDAVASSTQGVPAKVAANVENSGSSDLSNVKVEFFKDSISTANKLGETTLSSIAAGTAGTAYIDWAPESGNYKIFGRVTAAAGGIDRYITSNITVPVLYITEMCVNSDDGPDIYTNPDYEIYDYLEIYNNTKSAVNMKDYKIRVHNMTGATWHEFDISADFIIPAKSTGVVWFNNPDCEGKTLTDFNAYYGTSLDSSQVYIMSAASDGAYGYLPNDQGARPVSIVTDTGDWISMSTYSEGLDLSLDYAVEKKSIVYKYPTDGTISTDKVSYNQTPTPGAVSTDQIPH